MKSFAHCSNINCWYKREFKVRGNKMESGNKLVYLHFESFEKYSIKVFTKNIPIKYFGGIL